MDSNPLTIRAAAVQAEPVILDRQATTEKACRLIEEAADHGAQLIVFPEAFIPLYPDDWSWGRGLARFESRPAKQAWARLWRSAVEVPGPTTETLGQAARRAHITLVMGINERAANTQTLYNTLIFFGPDGSLLGKHRKLMPTSYERMVWGMGDGSTLKVFDTPLGKIGGLICWENWMPLARYALYAQGEQIHVAPTADDRELTLVNIRNTAAEGRVFVISVCMVLRKSSYPTDFELSDQLADAPEFLEKGGSAIVAPDATVLAGPLWNEEGILYADLEMGRLAEERHLLDIVGHYARPDVLGLRFNTSPQNVMGS